MPAATTARSLPLSYTLKYALHINFSFILFLRLTTVAKYAIYTSLNIQGWMKTIITHTHSWIHLLKYFVQSNSAWKRVKLLGWSTKNDADIFFSNFKKEWKGSSYLYHKCFITCKIFQGNSYNHLLKVKSWQLFTIMILANENLASWFVTFFSKHVRNWVSSSFTIFKHTLLRKRAAD